jgi:hypothetical protein
MSRARENLNIPSGPFTPLKDIAFAGKTEKLKRRDAEHRRWKRTATEKKRNRTNSSAGTFSQTKSLISMLNGKSATGKESLYPLRMSARNSADTRRSSFLPT